MDIHSGILGNGIGYVTNLNIDSASITSSADSPTKLSIDATLPVSNLHWCNNKIDTNKYKIDTNKFSSIMDAFSSLVLADKKDISPKLDTISSEGNNTTVVRWKDGTVTTVRCSENDTPDIYGAFCAALAKKIYGTTSAVYREIDKHNVETINAKKQAEQDKNTQERLERERINHARKIRRIAKRMREQEEARKYNETGEIE